MAKVKAKSQKKKPEPSVEDDEAAIILGFTHTLACTATFYRTKGKVTCSCPVKDALAALNRLVAKARGKPKGAK